MENYITKEGLKKLKNQLDESKIKLKEVAQKIKEAREYGDLSENAEYHEAKNEQSFLLGKEQELEEKIKNAKIIEQCSDKSYVSIGCKVEVKSSDGSEIYQIVGSDESDPLLGKISADSPIGKALVGHSIGDEVSVNTPAGKLKYKILTIQ